MHSLASLSVHQFQRTLRGGRSVLLVFTSELQGLLVSLGVRLLLDDLSKLGLELGRYNGRVVVQLFETFHDLLRERLVTRVARAGHVVLIGLYLDPFRKVPVYSLVLALRMGTLSMLAVVTISLQLLSFLRLSACILARIATRLLAVVIYLELEADRAELLLLRVSAWLAWLRSLSELLILGVDRPSR